MNIFGYDLSSFEKKMYEKIKQGIPNDWIMIENIIIDTQPNDIIDAILITPHGLIVIDVRSYYGVIRRIDYSLNKWKTYSFNKGKTVNTMLNPMNFAINNIHSIKALNDINPSIIMSPLVIFSDEVVFEDKLKNRKNIIAISELKNYIGNYIEKPIAYSDEVVKIVNYLILKNNITDEEIRRDYSDYHKLQSSLKKHKTHMKTNNYTEKEFFDELRMAMAKK